MKFVALVSGGKDSVYSILQCIRLGHELLACVHLGAPPEVQEESYMYQSAASEALTVLVEQCLQVPLIYYPRQGKSINTSLVYQDAIVGDEVEDLYQALSLAKQEYPSLQAVSSGAILSTYQRIRIEHVCSRLNLTSLSYLWRAAPQHQLLDQMIQDGITAVLVRAACPPGLKPHRHLNKTLQELQPTFLRLNQLYQFHVCGEGGEYESLVLDCPVYKKKLVLDEVQVVELEGDEGVGVLKILKCHAEEKETSDEVIAPAVDSYKTSTKVATQYIPAVAHYPKARYLPPVQFLDGGLWHVSEIMVPVAPVGDCSEAELAVQEACTVLQILDRLLKHYGCTAQDVLFVHLYLSEISHFASINASYRKFFGTLLPPSRSCVGIGKQVLPGGRRVLLDCMVQCGSGNYMRGIRTTNNQNSYTNAALDNKSFQLRSVLHVESISNWAPVTVGPYSQCNTLRSALHFMAGQIGLKPATMTLHEQWTDQLHQCWTNVASVLDALEGNSLENLLSSVVYVADHVYFSEENGRRAIQQVDTICQEEMKRNGGIVAGKVDSPIADDSIDQDEDDYAGVGSVSTCPCLVVSIPEMPVGAVVEVEVIAATQKAGDCLNRADTNTQFDLDCLLDTGSERIPRWDTGHDFEMANTIEESSSGVQIHTHMRTLGAGCVSFATVTAHVHQRGDDIVNLNSDSVLSGMIKALVKALALEESGALGLGLKDALHVRLFYLSSNVTKTENGHDKTVLDDGVVLRSALRACLASHGGQAPACSVVPVQAIDLVPTRNSTIILALHATVMDPVQLETELWIHHGRT